jgi:hypothetical protein
MFFFDCFHVHETELLLEVAACVFGQHLFGVGWLVDNPLLQEEPSWSIFNNFTLHGLHRASKVLVYYCEA